MSCEDKFMTDYQFETYNKLLVLVDNIIDRLPEDLREKYSNKKSEILTRKTI